MSTKYKITSPENFREDQNIMHGTFKIFDKIPDWAIDNVRILIEKIEVDDDNVQQLNKNDIELQVAISRSPSVSINDSLSHDVKEKLKRKYRKKKKKIKINKDKS